MDDFTRRLLHPRKNTEAQSSGRSMDDFTRRMLGSRESVEIQSSFHHQAGTYAVLALPTSILLNVLLMGFPDLAAGLGYLVGKTIMSMIPGVILLSALPAGIIALCGIPKFGKKRLLWKGLVGVIVPVLLGVMAVFTFLKVKSASEEKTRQQHESR